MPNVPASASAMSVAYTILTLFFWGILGPFVVPLMFVVGLAFLIGVVCWHGDLWEVKTVSQLIRSVAAACSWMLLPSLAVLGALIQGATLPLTMGFCGISCLAALPTWSIILNNEYHGKCMRWILAAQVLFAALLISVAVLLSYYPRCRAWLQGPPFSFLLYSSLFVPALLGILWFMTAVSWRQWRSKQANGGIA